MDTEMAYTEWTKRQTPANLSGVVTSLSPVIGKALHGIGADDDPIMKVRAQLHVADAVPRYKAEKGAKLETFMTNELKRLQRYGAQMGRAITVPEQASADIRTIRGAASDFEDAHGRVPTAEELADSTGLSTRRIGMVQRRYSIPEITTGQMAANSPYGETPEFGSAPDELPEDRLWLEAVYGDLDAVDKNIMDWSMGRHGQEPLPKTEIAKRLKISPAAVTQRAMRIAGKLDTGGTV